MTDLLDEELAGLDRLDASGDAERLPAHLWERALGAPAHEFLRRPGKQFRSQLVASAWCLGGGALHEMPAVLPSIVEILHAGSLIVDDIEDGATTRRNAPALHRLVGIPTALNTGNWMYFWPFLLIERMELPQERKARISREAIRAVERCHRGQALDLALTVSSLQKSEVAKVVRATTRLKTASLMELAAVIGAIASGASEANVQALRLFARSLGEGLQMLDDLGSIASPSRAHKGREDLMHQRPTWPWAWLALSCGDFEYQSFVEQLGRVHSGELSAGRLAESMCAVIKESGRERVHSSLQLSLAGLRDHFGEQKIIHRMQREIERLEKSYE